jgi:hypothetical protein
VHYRSSAHLACSVRVRVRVRVKVRVRVRVTFTGRILELGF